MSSGSKPRSGKQRSGKERLESLGLPKPRLVVWWQRGDKSDLALRITYAVLAGVAILLLCHTWELPFSYRSNDIPTRDLVTRVTFDVLDEDETKTKQQRKSRSVIATYRNRPQVLDQLRAALKDQLFLVLSADSFPQLSEDERSAFGRFYEDDEADEDSESSAERFAMMKAVLAQDKDLDGVDRVVREALKEVAEKGLLKALQHEPAEGHQQRIRVYRSADDEFQSAELSEVRIAQVGVELRRSIRDRFRQDFPQDEDRKVASMISDWLINELPQYETLQYDDDLTEKDRIEAIASVEPEMVSKRSGRSKLATAGKPLSVNEIHLLHKEWEEIVGRMTWRDQAMRVISFAGMIATLYLSCGAYIFFVDDRSLLRDHGRLIRMLLLMVAAITLGYYAASDQWRCELIPLVLASIIAGAVYGRELGLLLMVAACLCVTLLLGAGLDSLVVFLAACTACVLLLGRIRTRTHFLYVGGAAAGITAATVVGAGVITGEMLSVTEIQDTAQQLYHGPTFGPVLSNLFRQAGWAIGCIMVSATAMTGLLPLVEKGFGIQTDLSLLELGDASHPLLRRLAQRAPGTYNHSINVASMAEAAADSIGANGLLVRVGAYFHDIGKMFKPEYFIENQSSGVNQHDTLQPAMSTLVIIAHVKDGADLARNHRLPEPIIDFIMQHHGTTLVEYFYREASKRSEEDPNGESVSDKDFRYPGPKPQTREAAVLMLADTVESASRTLVDPTPARIQGLVDAIAQKKVADGQFDECGLTFSQLHRVRQSLVKSLTAIYHARVKYPGQQSA
ncbi:MAG: HDIG domain-containing metalloprotein [Planctomycetota bacterium]